MKSIERGREDDKAEEGLTLRYLAVLVRLVENRLKLGTRILALAPSAERQPVFAIGSTLSEVSAQSPTFELGEPILKC